jgi:hypothetical protein
LEEAFCQGLQALSTADQKKVTCKDATRLAGSVNLDDALAKTQPQAPRWDYGIGVKANPKRDRVCWVEVHPANASHIQPVLKKLQWLRGWLEGSAPLLQKLSSDYVWIAAGKVALPSNSPQRKKLAMKGLRFVGRELKLC